MSGDEIYGTSGFVHNNVTFNIPSRPYDQRFTYTDEYDVQPLEFIAVTGTEADERNKNVSRRIRSQAMRNYVWRQNHPTTTDEMAAAAAVPLKVKSQQKYEGKFRIGSRPRKTKKAAKAKLAILGSTTTSQSEQDQESVRKALLRYSKWSIRQSLMPDKNLLMRKGANSDPFNAFSFPMGPESEQFIFYYQKHYAVNCIALNLSPDCWYFVREELALFHAVLYLVSLDYNMKYGLIDSPGSLFHGREAFRLINEAIKDNAIRDTLIAAVSLVITRENLAGKFEMAKIHMQGLQLMVHQRGGIQNVESIHRNVITWADLCYSNIWDCKPSFPLLPLKLTGPEAELPTGMKSMTLSPARTFGSGSLINSIFRSLRRLSIAFCPEYDARLDGSSMSNQIYSVEYDLLTLQNINLEALNASKYLSSSSVLMNIAAYIYLYLILRELPVRSKLFHTLFQRLRDSLEMQDTEWWNLVPERQRWLLWVVFMGYGAASEWDEKWLFVEKMEPLGAALMLGTKEELRSAFQGVIWHDRCEEFLERLWNDISHREGNQMDD
ncbi:hypothetical protein MKX08_000118 [Trichoderma sp. CBMAI-0020]|nr:hypothetical protein MKX08_000118 [Trichoderma sp. CBMAI-0020]